MHYRDISLVRKQSEDKERQCRQDIVEGSGCWEAPWQAKGPYSFHSNATDGLCEPEPPSIPAVHILDVVSGKASDDSDIMSHRLKAFTEVLVYTWSASSIRVIV
jgi:hypothetical protein